MGGIRKSHFSEIKALLRLSDEAMELADRHHLEEKKLRYVTTVSSEYHTEIVRQIIDFNLSSKQVKDLCEGNELTDNNDSLETLPAAALKMAKVTQSLHLTNPQDLARALMKQEGHTELARARLHAMQQLIADTDRYLSDK
jgi:hypothetical protein